MEGGGTGETISSAQTLLSALGSIGGTWIGPVLDNWVVVQTFVWPKNCWELCQVKIHSEL